MSGAEVALQPQTHAATQVADEGTEGCRAHPNGTGAPAWAAAGLHLANRAGRTAHRRRGGSSTWRTPSASTQPSSSRILIDPLRLVDHQSMRPVAAHAS